MMADPKPQWSVLTPDLKFRRTSDGKIVMRLGGEQTYISAEKWATFLASLSAPVPTVKPAA